MPQRGDDAPDDRRTGHFQPQPAQFRVPNHPLSTLQATQALVDWNFQAARGQDRRWLVYVLMSGAAAAAGTSICLKAGPRSASAPRTAPAGTPATARFATILTDTRPALKRWATTSTRRISSPCAVAAAAPVRQQQQTHVCMLIRFGVYLDAGDITCAGFPGSLGHEEADVEWLVSVGADCEWDGNRADMLLPCKMLLRVCRPLARRLQPVCRPHAGEI